MRTTVGIIAACTLSTLAHAQDAPSADVAPAPAEETARKAHAALLVYGDYTFSSDLDDGDGDVSVWRAGASLDMSFPIGATTNLGASFRAERWGFDFGDATAFDSADGQPWDDVTDLAFLLSLRHQWNDRWSSAIGGGIESGFADGADFNDSISGGGFVTASYKFNESLTAGLGVSVRTVLEDNTQVVPFLILDWKIADQWRLTTSPGISRRLIGLAYTPCEQVTITLGGGYERLDFRLDDSDPAPEGVGRYQRIPVGLEVTWNVSRQFGVSIYGGAQVWQQYELDNQNGDQLAKDDAGIAPFFGAAVEWKF